MARTFSSLAVLLTIAMLASIGVGFWSFFTPGHADKNTIFLLHFWIGLVTAIGILLVHCLVFTYFLGTGRWVKEVTLAYNMPDEPHHKETRELKRKTFPPALLAMLVGISTAFAGAGAQLQEWTWHIHATLALATLIINLIAFRIEHRNLARNVQVIQGVLDEVDRMRAARGLQPNAEALQD